MKHLKLFALFLPLFGMIGCFDSNTDDCPPKVLPNATVRFSQIDVGGNESLGTTIFGIDLFVYDPAGSLVERVVVSREELATFAGVRLRLDPGTYTLVAWANGGINSNIVVDGTAPYLDHTKNYLQNALPIGGVVKNGDPLYYAPKIPSTPLTMVVPQEGDVEVTAEMRHAHVKIEVTVVGYNHTRALADPLEVELTQLTSNHDFAMNQFGPPVSYIQSAPNINEVTMEYFAHFNVPLFDRTTPTELLLRNRAGVQIIPAVLIRSLISDQVDIDKMVHIPIKIDFNTGDPTIKAIISVTLSTWGETIVIPVNN